MSTNTYCAFGRDGLFYKSKGNEPSMIKLATAALAAVAFAAPVAACPITDWMDARRPYEAKLGSTVTIGAEDCQTIRELFKINDAHQRSVFEEIKRGGTTNFEKVNRENDKMWTACHGWGRHMANAEAAAMGGHTNVVPGTPCAANLGTWETGAFGPGVYCRILPSVGS